MIVVSSISPKHSNGSNQQNAIDSWNKYGLCFSLNTEKETEVLSDNYTGISFIETHKTLETVFGKPFISINSIIDFAIQKNDDLLIVNSDIVINELPPLKTDGMSFFSRYDYTDHWGDAKMFQAGFDVYFIPKELLKIFYPSVYAMGVAFWDYWIIMVCINKGIPVYWPQGKYAYHKIHPTQYSVEEWLYIGAYFKWEFKVHNEVNIGQMATHFLNLIKEKAIK